MVINFVSNSFKFSTDSAVVAKNGTCVQTFEKGNKSGNIWSTICNIFCASDTILLIFFSCCMAMFLDLKVMRMVKVKIILNVPLLCLEQPKTVKSSGISVEPDLSNV